MRTKYCELSRSQKQSKMANQIVTLGILRCLEILVLLERTLSLTKSALLHPGCWQGQSLILGCTVMTSHLPAQNYLKVNFWRSDAAFEITMCSILTAQKTAAVSKDSLSPELPDWLIERASSQLSYMLSFWPTCLCIENLVSISLCFLILGLLCRQSKTLMLIIVWS